VGPYFGVALVAPAVTAFAAPQARLLVPGNATGCYHFVVGVSREDAEVNIPETKYARSGNMHIAYQVIGEGHFDLLFLHGWISHIEHLWEE
jgi:hypothetical protein